MLERLKKLRYELGLTQAEFAEKLGIKQSTYSSIESGRYKLTDRYISQICMVFNVNENWIRNGEGAIFENIAKKQEIIRNMIERLKLLRHKLCLTQSEFASVLGLNQSSYSLIETGKINLSERYIKTLVALYNVNEQWLRTGEGTIFLSSPQEKELVKIFKSLSPASQNYLLKMAQGLVEVQKDKE